MANVNSAIVTALASGIQRKNDYRGNVQVIPIFVDASEALVNNGDTITLTEVLPPNTTALAIALNHDGSNGLAASTTLTPKSGTTSLVTTAIATSTDTNSQLLVHSLKNTDVGGTAIIATVGGADWSDTVDLYGFILVATDE